MGAASPPKAIGAVLKVLLLDRFQQHRHRSLDNLVLERRFPNRALAPIVLDVMPGVAFPPVGPLGLGSPPSQVLCSATTTSLPVSGRFACRSLPDTLRASVAFVVSPMGS